MDSISRRRFVGAAATAALGSLVSPRLLRADYDRWGPIVKSIGFIADS